MMFGTAAGDSKHKTEPKVAPAKDKAAEAGDKAGEADSKAEDVDIAVGKDGKVQPMGVPGM